MIKYPSNINLILLSNKLIRQFILIGRNIDSQRYFYHNHSIEDNTINGDIRESELGNSIVTSTVYLLVKHGLPFSESIKKQSNG
ncbi:MAG: hypothetical protein CL851_05135 [Crocinitomicaceae bacterium]|nr:hypothetical protein [Crocinitomicaceae bacterium]